MRYLLLPLFILSSILLFGQDSNKLSDCFLNGDAKSLSTYFNTSIELNLPENNGIYQQEQARILLDKFFSGTTINSYEIKHEGGSNQKSRFHIGKLETNKGSYRTYLLYNTKNGMMQIIELRIEEE